MTKSELIEINSAKQKHLPAKDIELAVKQMLFDGVLLLVLGVIVAWWYRGGARS